MSSINLNKLSALGNIGGVLREKVIHFVSSYGEDGTILTRNHGNIPMNISLIQVSRWDCATSKKD
jgi:hypothetical protein